MTPGGAAAGRSPAPFGAHRGANATLARDAGATRPGRRRQDGPATEGRAPAGLAGRNEKPGETWPRGRRKGGAGKAGQGGAEATHPKAGVARKAGKKIFLRVEFISQSECVVRYMADPF